jgi:hypothetical protein
MRPIRTIVLALAVAFVAAPVAAASATPDFLTPNLVQNPGAELGDSAQGGFVASIPSWWHDQRRPTVVRYGTPGFPTVAQGAAVGGGAAFFAGGPADGRDDDTPEFSRITITQKVYLLDKLDNDGLGRLKDGRALAIISACLGGYATQDDGVDVRLATYGDRGEGKEHATLHGPSAAERGGTTGLLPRTAALLLPPEADTLEVALDFVRASGTGTYNDGYADNLSVRLSVADGTEPEPSCAFDAPPAPAPAPAPGNPVAAKPVASGSAAAAPSSTGGSNTAVPLMRVGDRMKLRHGVAALKLRCAARDGACAGSVSLKTQLGRLGSAGFQIGAGKVGTIEVRIGRKMRRRLAALSRGRLAKLEVTATARLGTATTTFVYRAAP